MNKKTIIAVGILIVLGAIIIFTTPYISVPSTPIVTETPDTQVEKTEEAEVPAPVKPVVTPPKPTAVPLVSVTPLSVVEDSRCPYGVQCVWAGTVKVDVRVTTSTGQSQTAILTLGQAQTIAGVSVTLTEVSPDKTLKQLSFSDYHFSFLTK